MECLRKGGKVKQKQKQKQKQHQTVNVYVGQRTRKPKASTNERRQVRQQIEMPRFAMHDSGFQRLATPLTHNMPLNAVNAFEPARHIALPISAEPMKPAPLSSLPSLVPTYITPAEPQFAPGERDVAVSSQLEDHTPFSQEKEHNKPVPLSSFGEDEEPEQKEAHQAHSDTPVPKQTGLSLVSPEDEIALLEGIKQNIKKIKSDKGGQTDRKGELNQLASAAGLRTYASTTNKNIAELKQKYESEIDKKIADLRRK